MTFDHAAAALAEAARNRQSVRILGAATKRGWGVPTPAPDLELRSTGLDQIVEHNAGDLTAVLQAGVPLAAAQATFAAAGQMLALDPPLAGGTGATTDDRPTDRHGTKPTAGIATNATRPTAGVASDDEPTAGDATIGGIVATGDCGPLGHRYGAPRDLVLGMTVALSDGTIARSGGKVIKNVAGYDIAKLFAGSFGTLGMILSVSVRLHPLPATTATALGAGDDPELLRDAARSLAAAPLELESLDMRWRAGRGQLLARSGGTQAARRTERVAQLMRRAGLAAVDVADRDHELWATQRAAQRSPDRAIVRVAGRPSALAAVIRATEQCGGRLVGRAALGSSYIEVDPEAVGRLRRALPPRTFSTLLDAPAALRARLDPWGSADGPALGLMRTVKARFDPTRACNPGLFAGGI